MPLSSLAIFLSKASSKGTFFRSSCSLGVGGLASASLGASSCAAAGAGVLAGAAAGLLPALLTGLSRIEVADTVKARVGCAMPFDLPRGNFTPACPPMQRLCQALRVHKPDAKDVQISGTIALSTRLHVLLREHSINQIHQIHVLAAEPAIRLKA